MKTGTVPILKSMIAVGLAALTAVFFDARPALAQTQEACPLPDGVSPPPDPAVTAQQVEDGSASLRDFALAARERLNRERRERLYLYNLCLIRQEGGPYRSGSTYLVQLTLDRRVYVHAKEMALSGRRLKRPIYGAILTALGVSPADLGKLRSTDPAIRGPALAALNNTLSQEPEALFDAADVGVPDASGHVSSYYSETLGVPIIQFAGFDLNETHLDEEVIDYGEPAITARDVVDRETLKAFVAEAGKYFLNLFQTDNRGADTKSRLALRDENGPWRHGSVYLYVLDLNSNTILVHGAFPDRFEFRPLVATVRDAVTGEFILPQVIEAAKSSPEGGFVEYYFDDPTDDTDSADVPKVGYARQFTGEFPRADGSVLSLNFIIGSGFYGREPEVVPDGSCPLPAGVTPPADPAVTAQQVEDGSASLKDFALAARHRYKTPTSTLEEALYFQCRVRQEGSPWRSGSTYLVQLTPDGRVYEHSKSMALSGRLLNPLIYAQILTALGVSPTVLADLASPDPAVVGGAFGAIYGALEQEPDAPFDATSLGIPGASGHAAVSILGSSRLPIVLLAGFDLNESHLVEEAIDSGDPAVTARDVVDRETLKAFVAQAGEWFIPIVETATDPAAISKARIAARDPNGPWRHGPVYLYVLDLTSKVILFHGAFPDRFEWRPLVATVRDAVTGRLVLPQVIDAAKSSPEGGFVEYYFDDPTDDTDSADIPKVGYARQFAAEIPRADGTVFEMEVIIGSGFYGREPEVVPDGPVTEVEATVIGDAVEGLTVEFSRSVSGRSRHYAWKAVTDAAGRASLTISSPRRVGGFYQARARNAAGEIVGQWNSIPLNRNRRQVLELTLGGGMRLVRVEPLAAAKAVASAGGLGSNAPNPFNSSTQIAYRLSSPGPVQLVVYNVLGQPVRTLVDESRAAGSYRVEWDARDQRGVLLSSGIYIARLSYPGGVQSRRLLYLK